MSVVNQMLRDLDRRQAGDERRVFGQHLRPAGAANRGRWIAIALGLLAAAGATAYALRGADLGKAPQSATEVAIAPTSAPPVQPTAPSPVSSPPIAAAPAIAAEPTPKQPAVAVEQAPREAAPLPKANAEQKPAQRREAPPANEVKSAEPPRNVAAVAPAPAIRGEPASGNIDKRFRDDASRSADGQFRRAAAFIEQGRMQEASTALRSAIAIEPRHEAARQTLAALLIEAGAAEDAASVLEDGLRLNLAQSNFALVLARLKFDRGDTAGALGMLREHGGAAAANPEYRAFVAALLQRLGRHGEAIDEYQAALKLAPGIGVWWIGLGLSQEAMSLPAEAAEAFRRAKASGTLTADLADFVERKLQANR